MKKILSIVVILLVSASVFADDAEIKKLLGDYKMVEIEAENYTFSVGVTEVTQQLYEAVTEENIFKNKYKFLPAESMSFFDAVYFCNKISKIMGYQPVYALDDDFDVDNWDYTPHTGQKIEIGHLSWDQTKNGYRLPLIAEWKYCADGDEEYLYSGSDKLDEVGWYDKNSDFKSHNVGKKKHNAFGLYDMSGNVWEWCWDQNPKFTHDVRYYCGGSYKTTEKQCATKISSSGKPEKGAVNVGIRLFRSIVPPKPEKPVEKPKEKPKMTILTD